MANKESMIFYQEWRKAVEELPTEQRCLIYEAIFDYAFAGIQPEDAIIGAITSIMRMRIDKDREAYETKCEKLRANVQKRWNKRNKSGTSESKSIQLNTDEYNCIQTDSDTDTETDNYSDVANATTITSANADASARADEAKARKEEKVNFEALLRFFNSEMDKANAIIPRAKNISGQRLTMLKARIREYGKEAVAEVIRKAARSNFLNGGGSKGFKVDFTWIVRPENFLKILEGKFDNDDSSTTLTTTTTPQKYVSTKVNIQHNDREARQQEFARHIATRLTSPDDEPDVSGNY